jgi:hypothetical protein
MAAPLVHHNKPSSRTQSSCGRLSQLPHGPKSKSPAQTPLSQPPHGSAEPHVLPHGQPALSAQAGAAVELAWDAQAPNDSDVGDSCQGAFCAAACHGPLSHIPATNTASAG